MSLFWNDIANINRAYCASRGLPQPPTYDSVESDEDIALEKLTDEYRIDLLDQFRNEESTKFVMHEHELEETDLYERLITIAALWNGKPDTALERMRLIDQLLYDAAQNIAVEKARKDLDL